MIIPDNLKYTKDHIWVSIDGDIITAGITDFAQKQLNDIVYVEIPTLDKDLKTNDVFGVVDAVKTASDLFMPVDGKIIEVNPILSNYPETINTDPYNNGWIIKILAYNISEESFLSHTEYLSLIEC